MSRTRIHTNSSHIYLIASTLLILLASFFLYSKDFKSLIFFLDETIVSADNCSFPTDQDDMYGMDFGSCHLFYTILTLEHSLYHEHYQHSNSNLDAHSRHWCLLSSM